MFTLKFENKENIDKIIQIKTSWEYQLQSKQLRTQD